MDPNDLLAAMRRTVEQLSAFNEIAKALTSTLEVREVMALVMQKVSELLQPGNWSLVLQDEVTQELYFELCVGQGAERLKGLRFRVGEGIAGSVFASGAARLVENVEVDPSFSRRFDEATAFRTRSVLAVPLRSRGKILGVIELVNGDGRPAFTQEDLQIISGVADYAAIAIENARLFERLQQLTIADEHTGLFNARHLRAVLEAEVARARRFHHPVSLIFLDLDGFKEVNDTHGHLIGSALLAEVGTLIQKTIRHVDVAFRYGGDEFAVVLIETAQDGARIMAERLRTSFAQQRFMDHRGMDISLTTSVGVATFPDHAAGATELLEAADAAMYRAKGEGKNAVRMAG